jgi:hypothetical protein
MPYLELEIGLYEIATGSYGVQLSYTSPVTRVETRIPGSPAPVSFPLDTLRGLTGDTLAYGRSLATALFAGPEIAEGWARAREHANVSELQLRVRLVINPAASSPGGAALHALRWETLCDPRTGDPLMVGQRTLFSRHIISGDSRGLPPLSRSTLSVLVAVAAAPDLRDKGFAPLDAADELSRARASLHWPPIVALHETGPVTLRRLTAALEDGPHVLYLVAHGALPPDGRPRLWLQGEDGAATPVAGDELVSAIRRLAQPPRLIILASCDSAGAGRTPDLPAPDGPAIVRGNDALVALGPRLAEAGVGAVVAMQGQIPLEAAEGFTRRFFERLQRHGIIDLAVAEGRGEAQAGDDWWRPALFMRLITGELWDTAGYVEGEFDKWDVVVGSIHQGMCTAILGPDLTESLIGSRREIAQRLAEAHDFPLAEDERDDLPQVAQYLMVEKDRNTLYSALPCVLFRTLLERFDLTPELRALKLERLPTQEVLRRLDVALQVAAAEISARPGAVQPHAALANLPIPLYITTSPDSLLVNALDAAHRPPGWEMCRWYPGSESRPPLRKRNTREGPTAGQPLVYQLFGHLSDLESLVITEDAYFRFLRGVSENRKLIPADVKGRLVDSALLFLGFRLDDWNFRILHRGFLERPGSELSRNFTHVAAQIDLERSRIRDPERARHYLERYFENAAIHIFWGTAEEFLKELQQRV